MSAGPELLILVRHATTLPGPEADSASWRLAGSAEEECRRLALALAPLEPHRIVTSDHHKAEATGDHLARHLDLPCETVTGLEEHDRSGVPFYPEPSEWLAVLRRLFDRPDDLVLGNETASQALLRYEQAIRREVDRHPGERLVLVSHATVMALLVAGHNDLDPYEFWQTIEMPEALVLGLPDFRLLDRLTAGGVSNRAFNS